MSHLYTLLGRVGLSLVFISAGLGKIAAYAATREFMELAGVSGDLLPLVILFELGGGLAILVGRFTRFTAAAFAVLALANGVLFHWDFTHQAQFISLIKNVAIAGGAFLLAATGAGAFSLDAVLDRHDDDLMAGECA